MTTTRPALRWALPFGLAVAVVGTVSLGPLVRGWAADDVGEPGATAILAQMVGTDVGGVSGTLVVRADLGLPDLPVGLAGLDGTSWLSLLMGDHTLRAWIAGPDRVRLALLGSLAESDLVVDGEDVWLWESSSSAVTHQDLTAAAPDDGGTGPADDVADAPDAASSLLGSLAALAGTSTVGAGPSTTVAGRPAHQLVLAPSSPGSLVGSIRVAVDAEHGVPLRVQVFAEGAPGSPAMEVAFTRVTFGAPDAGVLAFTPPPGATVDERSSGDDDSDPGDGWTVVGQGWTSVLVGRAPDLLGAIQGEGEPDAVGQLFTLLPQVSGPWGNGRLLTSRLLSALLTDDGRLLLGAVDGDRLQEVAAEIAASPGNVAQP